MSLHSSILRSSASAVILCAGAELCPAADQTAEFMAVHSAANIPFELTIEQVSSDIAELPTLHSYVLGHSGTAWLFLGGRTNGLHGMTGQGAFPTASANSDLWVVDLGAGRSWRRPLSKTGPGSHFLLVFGQNYPGRYRPNFNGTCTKPVETSPVVLPPGSGRRFYRLLQAAAILPPP